jgi:geranylgeranyl diphosphate synthase type II
VKTIYKADLKQYLASRAQQVNAWLDRLVPAQTSKPENLHRAMRYSLFAGGKRLRPILVLASGEALGASTEALMPTACAIEMIHTYSLIHDDLPAMDDDDIRRGRPTCHKVFGEAVAILAGDALLTLAFQVLASAEGLDPDLAIRVMREVAAAAGTCDALIGGQAMDLESEGKDVDPETLERIHRSKTGALIRASVVSGGIIAGASQAQLDMLRTYGEKIGLAFQITDDILDVTSSNEQLGKTAGKDQAARKATYPAIFGIEASRARAQQLIEEAVSAISELGAEVRWLEAIARYSIARSH